jgi:hypothetical protein
MDASNGTAQDLAAEKLAGEVADVEASISLVATGVASQITLTGLRFGQQVADRLAPAAALRGVEVLASFWPEDTVADVHVSRMVDRSQRPDPETLEPDDDHG